MDIFDNRIDGFKEDVMFAEFMQRLIKKSNVCTTVLENIDLRDGRYFYFICLPLNNSLCYNYTGFKQIWGYKIPDRY